MWHHGTYGFRHPQHTGGHSYEAVARLASHWFWVQVTRKNGQLPWPELLDQDGRRFMECGPYMQDTQATWAVRSTLRFPRVRVGVCSTTMVGRYAP